MRTIEEIQSSSEKFLKRYGPYLKTGLYAVMIVAYSAYFAYALNYDFGGEPSIRLLWVTMLVALVFFIAIIQDHFGDVIYDKILQPPIKFIERHWMIFKV